MSEHVDHNSALQAAIMLAEECLEDALADKLRAAAAELERLYKDDADHERIIGGLMDQIDALESLPALPAVPADVVALVARIAGWTCDCEYRNGEKCDACEARDVLAKHGEGEG